MSTTTSARDLQYLIAGAIMGALSRQDTGLMVKVTPQYDLKGNYLPELVVEGQESGHKVYVRVTTDES